MNEKLKKKDNLEVASDQLHAELVAIKDRLSAIETIESISNRADVEKYVREHLKNEKAKLILKECEEPRTRSHLRTTFKFNSDQAMYSYLKPLLDAKLLF